VSVLDYLGEVDWTRNRRRANGITGYQIAAFAFRGLLDRPGAAAAAGLALRRSGFLTGRETVVKPRDGRHDRAMTPEKAKASLIEDLKSEGFADVRVRGRIRSRRRRRGCANFSKPDGTARWAGWRRPRNGGPIRGNCGPRRESVVLAAMNYGPADSDEPLRALTRKDRATISSMRATATITTSSRAS
jgi:hypothetical protein